MSDDSVALAGKVSWADVEHWMWPLFSDRWLAFRIRLGLHSDPQLQAVAAPAAVPDSAAAPELCPAPLLLYGMPEEVVPMPLSWPEQVHMCGFWTAPTSEVRVMP